MNLRHLGRALCAMVLALPVIGVQAAYAAGSAPRHVLPGERPAWAVPSASEGVVDASAQVSGRVYLASRDASGLTAYATAVSTPGSSEYGRYLSPARTAARFGPSRTQTEAVRDWLSSAGLTVSAATRQYIAFQGTSAAVGSAFGTRLGRFTEKGLNLRAPLDNPSVPASLSTAVLGVTGLDDAPRLGSTPSATRSPLRRRSVDAQGAAPARWSAPGHVNPTAAPPDAATVNAGPFSDYYGQKTAPGVPPAYGYAPAYRVRGYTGTQFRAVYGAKPANTGAGVRVAIIDAYDSPTLLQDLSQNASNHGDAPYRTGQIRQFTPSAYTQTDICGPSSWFGEQSLDVEAVHAVAPAADLSVVSAASCRYDDYFDALSRIVDQHLGDIVSSSYYAAETVSPADVAAFEQLAQQAAVEGIGIYASSGDNGDLGDLGLDGQNSGEVAFPSRDPWVTSVGGTTLAVGDHNSYMWETGWGTASASLTSDGSSWSDLPGDFFYGAGGGAVKEYAQPWYQRGVVPGALAAPDPAAPAVRVAPDIAADADPTTGFLNGYTQVFPDGSIRYNEYSVGGTSLSAPITAGIQALAQQAQGGHPLGFANPSIYARYGTAAYHDPTGDPLHTHQPAAQVREDYVNGWNDSQGTVASLRTADQDTSLRTTVGYDETTGVGTPAAGYIASYEGHWLP